MPLKITPSSFPNRELDLTGVLTRAVAEELWRNFGGNDVLNWMEAERFVQSLRVQPAPETGRPGPLSHEVEPRPARRTHAERPRRQQPMREDEERVTGPLPVY
ncbi:MAG: hypothetical protein KF678_06665 [Phycisphaeraceae bacterium]|nr:hypothetical protein [Phycisphaeraceae bacterium]